MEVTLLGAWASFKVYRKKHNYNPGSLVSNTTEYNNICCIPEPSFLSQKFFSAAAMRGYNLYPHVPESKTHSSHPCE